MRVVFVGKDRVVWKRVLLYFLTFGISRRFWLHKINKEIDGHAALAINHTLNAVLLALPIGGPLWVQCRTAKYLNEDLRAPRPLRYGPTWAMCLVGFVPLLGNAFFVGYTQDRLNRYWAMQRDNEAMGIDIDVGLEEDPQFLIELEAARKESYTAGSRFDRKARLREERWRARVESFEEIRREREEVRAKGGSTPALPWLRPKAPPVNILHITCPCEHKFDVEQDPYQETLVQCPQCQRKEILAPVYGGGGEVEQTLHVTCPQCQAGFRAKSVAGRPVDLECPECGLKETLEAPA